MGRGIAQACAAGGYQVFLWDIKIEIVDQALHLIAQNLNEAVSKGKLTTEKRDQMLNAISPTVSDTLQADLIIEAVVEKLDVKQALFKKLEPQQREHTIFVSNTSSLSITSLANGLLHPGQVAGLHFFNPAHLMKLVEVVAGEKTKPEVMDTLTAFVTSIGKTPVRVKDSPGFIVNRVARPFYLEALRQVEQQSADIKTIDELMRAAGFKLGPFELMDLIGNDVNLAVSQQVYEAFHRPTRFQPSDIQKDKVARGELGRKTGKGYYHYEK